MSRKLIVGLGNPGPEYSLTRHNVGFLVAECLSDSEFLKAALAHAKTLPFSPEAKQNYKSPRNDLGRNGSSSQFKLVREHQAEIAVLPQFNLLIAKPVTYMNCSGEAVQKILHYFKIELENLLVVHDDVSLPLGKLRLQNGGGAGGQHGIESIIARLGGKTDFHRLKVGVGPDPGGATRANYVLSTVPAVDRALFADSIASAAEAAAAWLQGGLRITMNAYNGLEIGVPAALQEKRARDQQAREEKERKQKEEKERREREEQEEKERLEKEEQDEKERLAKENDNSESSVEPEGESLDPNTSIDGDGADSDEQRDPDCGA